jgi:nuclear GTP-binding protein
MKIYDLPTFSSMLEFLAGLALGTEASSKSVPPPLLQNSKRIISFLYGGTPNIPPAARHVPIDGNHQKIPSFSEPPAFKLHATHMPSTVIGSGGQAAPGADSISSCCLFPDLLSFITAI